MNLKAKNRFGAISKAARFVFNAFFSSGPAGSGTSFFWSGIAPFGGQLPGSQKDWRSEVGDLHLNGVVGICLERIVDNFIEPVFQVYRPGDDLASGDDVVIPNHPLAKLLRKPNNYYTGSTLWGATLLGLCCYGNAFWFKARDETGIVREVYPMFPWEVRPLYESNGSEFITAWEYLANGKWHRVPFTDIVHFRNGIDPRNPRWGLSPLEAEMREISADNEGSTWTASQLKKGTATALLLSPASEMVEFTPDVAKALGEQFAAQTSGDNRGRPIVMDSTTKVDTIGLKPTDMDIGTLRVIPEDRICAAMRVPTMVAGITSSGEKAVYSNYEMAISAFYDMCLKPIQAYIAEVLELELLPEVGGDAETKCRWNYSKVLALQTSFDNAAKTWRLSYRAGVATLNEARVNTGLPKLDDKTGGELFVQPELLSPSQQAKPESGGGEGRGRAVRTDGTARGGSQGLSGNEETDVEREAS